MNSIDIAYLVNRMEDVAYTHIPGTTITICTIRMGNGYTVVGESACVSAANFDESLGRKYAYNNAVDKLWPLEGYLLAERLRQEERGDLNHDMGWVLRQLKNGKKVMRRGWNGRGMWLELQVPDVFSKMTLPYVFINYSDGNRVPWLASQTDLLMQDWELVADAAAL